MWIPCRTIDYTGCIAFVDALRMITLCTFGPQFGLPDPSPFVTKADVLLSSACEHATTPNRPAESAPHSHSSSVLRTKKQPD
jgi:hypothetical protein